MVVVSPDDTWTLGLGKSRTPFAKPMPGARIAGDMYGGVWSDVRKQASRIAGKCFGFAAGGLWARW